MPQVGEGFWAPTFTIWAHLLYKIHATSLAMSALRAYPLPNPSLWTYFMDGSGWLLTYELTVAFKQIFGMEACGGKI